MSLVGLRDGLRVLGLEVSDDVCRRLQAYGELLLKWNRVYNLTAIRAPEQVLTHHLLDSLAIVPYLSGIKRLADVGSGGGLPGIPLAIVCPDIQIVSIESVGKKTSFQQQARIELGLENFSVLSQRVETLTLDSAGYFDAVVSRAFSSLSDFIALTRHLLHTEGHYLAMKGNLPEQELSVLTSVEVVAIHPLVVPGLDAERHLLIIKEH